MRWILRVDIISYFQLKMPKKIRFINNWSSRWRQICIKKLWVLKKRRNIKYWKAKRLRNRNIRSLSKWGPSNTKMWHLSGRKKLRQIRSKAIVYTPKGWEMNSSNLCFRQSKKIYRVFLIIWSITPLAFKIIEIEHLQSRLGWVFLKLLGSHL